MPQNLLNIKNISRNRHDQKLYLSNSHTRRNHLGAAEDGARNLVIEAQTGERCSCVSENKHEGQNQRKQNTSQKSHMKIQMIAATGKTI